VRLLHRGDRGDAVRDIQVRLASLGYSIDPAEHGGFGSTTEHAVRAFQERRRLLIDGVVGDHTWSELVEAGYVLGARILYLRYPYFRGDDVRALQAAMNLLGFDSGKEDGIFGARTDRAVIEFQRNVGLPTDGIVGVTTLAAVRRLRPAGPGPGRAEVREAEALRRLSASLEGARIAIDTGPGAGHDLGRQLVEELAGRGAAPFFLGTESNTTSDSDRADAANQAGAEILIGVQLNASGVPSPDGVTTIYYGREGWISQAGRRLAELIHQQLTLGLGLADLGTHPRSLPILRETKMPAVLIETTGPESLIASMPSAIADSIEAFAAGREPPSAGLSRPGRQQGEQSTEGNAKDQRLPGAQDL
jgi:N-acetylmuramoyl-L-alanine amidase